MYTWRGWLRRLVLKKSQALINIVIKPSPARQVDLGPGGWTGPGLIKDRLWQQPGQTWATRRVDPEPG